MKTLDVKKHLLAIDGRVFTPAIAWDRSHFKFAVVPLGLETCPRTGQLLYALPGGGRATKVEILRMLRGPNYVRKR